MASKELSDDKEDEPESFRLNLRLLSEIEELQAEPIAPKVPGEVQDGTWRKKKVNMKALPQKKLKVTTNKDSDSDDALELDQKT